jgi:hypothetical protein
MKYIDAMNEAVRLAAIDPAGAVVKASLQDDTAQVYSGSKVLELRIDTCNHDRESGFEWISFLYKSNVSECGIKKGPRGQWRASRGDMK